MAWKKKDIFVANYGLYAKVFIKKFCEKKMLILRILWGWPKNTIEKLNSLQWRSWNKSHSIHSRFGARKLSNLS